jgi:hypothetical protein
MVIAFAELSNPGDSLAGNDTGVPKYHVSIKATACDGTYEATTTLAMGLAAGIRTCAFNAAIVAAIETWVNNQHSWTIDPKNIYFQPFANGS